MLDLKINQPVVIIKDKRDPLDREGQRIEMHVARYEGYFPWAVKFHGKRGWLPGIFDYEEYESGEMVTIENVPMNSLYSTVRGKSKKFALPIYRHRFIVGKHKVWEHEIEYEIIPSQ